MNFDVICSAADPILLMINPTFQSFVQKRLIVI